MNPETRNTIGTRLVERRYPEGIVLGPISRVTGRAQTITANDDRY